LFFVGACLMAMGELCVKERELSLAMSEPDDSMRGCMGAMYEPVRAMREHFLSMRACFGARSACSRELGARSR